MRCVKVQVYLFDTTEYIKYKIDYKAAIGGPNRNRPGGNAHVILIWVSLDTTELVSNLFPHK